MQQSLDLHEYVYCEIKTDDYLHPSTDIYLQPCSVSSQIGSCGSSDHCYTSLQANKNNNNNSNHNINSQTPSNRKRKLIIRTALVCLVVGLVIGSTCSGISVYMIMRSSRTCGLPQVNENVVPEEDTYQTTEDTYSAEAITTVPVSSWTMSKITSTQKNIMISDNSTVQVQCAADGKIWHYNTDTKIVSALYQTSDNDVWFTFEKQTDESYKIKALGGNVYMYDSSSNLSGNYHRDDDHSRFEVTMETEGHYRIQTKATGNYLRLHENLYVSSKKNIKDKRSLYIFVKKNRQQVE